MKLFNYGKDGGAESHVWGYWLCEFKRLFSIVLLCFEDGSREAYHEHAFHSISWLLKGFLTEYTLGHWRGNEYQKQGLIEHRPSIRPIITRRDTFHRVVSNGRTWVLSIRGPWATTWREYLPGEDRWVTLTNGRREVA